MEKNIYNIPKENGMNVPGVVYASEKIYEQVKGDKTLEQVKNVAKLPGIIGKSIALPDCHQGYGFCIGGVAAFDVDKGIISPGGVGYDINCSVRLLKTNLKKEDILKKQKEISKRLYEKIPSGVGRGSPFQISYNELDKLLLGGAKYMVEKGYGFKEDYLFSEEGGCMEGADPSKVSERAKRRGIGQVGTIGSGNHFLEVQFVDDIFDKKIAKIFGLSKNQVVVMIHCGSRGLGHQVASDYIKKMEEKFFQKKNFSTANFKKSNQPEEKYSIKNLPDRELVYAPINSKLGKGYLSAMACAANFAFANKQLLTYWVREEFLKIFGAKTQVEVFYDVCHNIAKFEEHIVDGKKEKVCVHRKGATRSFGPGKIEIPKIYRSVGQPVLIPGSMGTASYVLAGQEKSEELTFGSSVHGAGRLMSRSLALRKLDPKKIKKSLNKSGIEIGGGTLKGFAEEAPEVYKDIEEVVDVVNSLRISKKVARMKPLIVVKG